MKSAAGVNEATITQISLIKYYKILISKRTLPLIAKSKTCLISSADSKWTVYRMIDKLWKKIKCGDPKINNILVV
jgi:hypothetical protein